MSRPFRANLFGPLWNRSSLGLRSNARLVSTGRRQWSFRCSLTRTLRLILLSLLPFAVPLLLFTLPLLLKLFTLFLFRPLQLRRLLLTLLLLLLWISTRLLSPGWGGLTLALSITYAFTLAFFGRALALTLLGRCAAANVFFSQHRSLDRSCPLDPFGNRSLAHNLPNWSRSKGSAASFCHDIDSRSFVDDDPST